MNEALLRDLLNHYHPYDPVERGHLGQMEQLLAASPSCFDRSHMLPGHFTASMFAVTPDRTQVVMIRHRHLNRWLQPGGHFEQSDKTPMQAACRELKEETGLCATGVTSLIDLDIHDIPASRGYPAHRHFDLRFLTVCSRQELAPGDDALEAEWTVLDNLRHHGETGLRRIHMKLKAEPGINPG